MDGVFNDKLLVFLLKQSSSNTKPIQIHLNDGLFTYYSSVFQLVSKKHTSPVKLNCLTVDMITDFWDLSHLIYIVAETVQSKEKYLIEVKVTSDNIKKGERPVQKTFDIFTTS